ncbi:MAG TPA: sodium:proton antiporter NhaD [Saprospiraceae bacterium]|nr:sodium:proton antiporter NhaD [Saprospiraceae bacterium]
MEWIMIFCFVAGYVAITLEHNININKAASALVAGVLCWTVYILGGHDAETVNHHLSEHISEITGIVFFLLGAMVIVELIDAHDGFENITQRIKTTDKRKLLWSVGFITFFLSAVLDNLTTTIVMISLLRKLVADREDRMKFAGLVIIAANAGGAWSPLGDVTTTMLWIGGQITALNIVKMLFLPSLVCLLLPLWLLTRSLKGKVQAPVKVEGDEVGNSTPYERNLVFGIGVGALLFVPVFKTITHLPPYMGILLGLGVMWILTEFIHSGKDEIEKGNKSVNHALRKIDTPSILFFLGILVAISALESVGVLRAMATWLDQTIGNVTIVGVLIGFLSAVVDNVPLVAAAQGMYSMEVYPADSFFWELIAYCAGTGGSTLIIGSAAGVAAMGMENISFTWYLRKFTLLASIGYLAGVAVYVLQHQIFG